MRLVNCNPEKGMCAHTLGEEIPGSGSPPRGVKRSEVKGPQAGVKII